MKSLIVFFAIIGGFILLGYLIKNREKINLPKFSTSGFKTPDAATTRLILAILGSTLVLGIFFLTESTFAFLGLVLWSKIFWGILLAFLVFWGIWTGNWTWLWRILGIAIAVWIAIWIFGVIVHWNDPKPGADGKTSTTTTTRTYDPGKVIFDGMTPCHPVIPRGYDLTPTGPVKMVFQTPSGPAIRRIREEAEAPPADRLEDRPVVITSLTAGMEYHIIIIAR